MFMVRSVKKVVRKSKRAEKNLKLYVVSVAASSGSVERAFSAASDILTAKRSAMKPDLFANLMLVKCNAGLNVGLNDV